MKNKFQDKFLHEIVFEIADSYKKNNYDFVALCQKNKIKNTIKSQ